jgi:putative transposase
VDFHLGGHRVVEVLQSIGKTRNLPKTIRVDNGPEFISKVLEQWAYLKG